MRGEILRRYLGLTIVGFFLTAGESIAAGGNGTQGPLFLGEGLDESSALPEGGSVSKGVQQFRLAAGKNFPPVAAGDVTPDRNLFSVTSLSCRPGGVNAKFVRCTAIVKTTLGNRVCNKPNGSTVNLIALNAAWLQATGGFDFSPPSSVVLGCEDSGIASEANSFGALGKCIRFGFLKTADNDPPAKVLSSQSRFLACVRATRADYCGNGVSMTEEGTPWAIYDLPKTRPQLQSGGMCIPRKACWEASWNEEGATCMNHRRYFSLLSLASIPRSTTGWNEAEVSAGRKESKVPDPKHPAVKPSLAEWLKTAPRLQVPPKDPLQGCAKTDSTLLACLQQFSRYYYDDSHEMQMLGNPNPVDPVTAQIICLPQFYRLEPSTIQTRTAVRFPNPLAVGGYDVLECSDTFHDCTPPPNP
jgi:hypothetical protein